MSVPCPFCGTAFTTVWGIPIDDVPKMARVVEAARKVRQIPRVIGARMSALDAAIEALDATTDEACRGALNGDGDIEHRVSGVALGQLSSE